MFDGWLLAADGWLQKRSEGKVQWKQTIGLRAIGAWGLIAGMCALRRIFSGLHRATFSIFANEIPSFFLPSFNNHVSIQQSYYSVALVKSGSFVRDTLAHSQWQGPRANPRADHCLGLAVQPGIDSV